MTISHRIDQIHKDRRIVRRQSNQQTGRPSRPQRILGTFRAPAKVRKMVALEQDVIPTSVFLVARRPPLSEHPFVWRWLARLVYQRINWAPEFGIEYQGVFTDEAEARHAASEVGGFVIAMPLNASLPLQTCQFGAHDFPLSEASRQYRNRKFPFVAVPRSQLERLQEKIRATDSIVGETRAKAI